MPTKQKSLSTPKRMKLLIVVLILGTGLVGQSTPALSASVSGSVTPRETWSLLSSQKLVHSNTNSDLGDSSEDGQYYDDDAGVTFVTDEDVLYEENSATPSPFISSSNYNSGNINPHSNSNLFAAHSNSAQFQVNSNLRQPGDEWSDGRCPPFPEIPTSSKSHRELCESRRRCSRDSDCISSSGSVSGSGSGSDASLICCYNGCIHSCQHKIDPPLAFDWLEETELMTWQNTTDLDEDSTSAPVITTTSRMARSKSSSSTKEPRDSGGQKKMRKKALLGAGVGRETIALPGGCFLNSVQYENLRQFRKHQHVDSCMCSEGDVVCQVNVEKDRLPSSSIQNSGLVQTMTLIGNLERKPV